MWWKKVSKVAISGGEVAELLTARSHFALMK